MVEVFKTDVCDPTDAGFLIDMIRKAYPCYKVNFDLQDCDHILRIETFAGDLSTNSIIRLLEQLGYTAEVLPDEIPLFYKK